MNQRERKALMAYARGGTKAQAQTARARFKRAADIQNVRESSWSLAQLCKTLQREGNGRPLSVAERSRCTPYVLVGQDNTVRVFAWWDAPGAQRWATEDAQPYGVVRYYAKAIYTGLLANYWRVTLRSGETRDDRE